jgi:hypothetical protein
MHKGKFNTAQEAQLNTYLPEFVQKLDAGVRGLELTQWKQSTATKALASPLFADLDFSIMPRTNWFKVFFSIGVLNIHADNYLPLDHCAQIHKLLQQCLQEITRGGALSLHAN